MAVFPSVAMLPLTDSHNDRQVEEVKGQDLGVRVQKGLNAPPIPQQLLVSTGGEGRGSLIRTPR